MDWPSDGHYIASNIVEVGSVVWKTPRNLQDTRLCLMLDFSLLSFHFVGFK